MKIAEVDYMSDKDFEAIYAITFEAPQRIGTMIASTPTGRRGMFYKVCTQMRMNQDVKISEDNKYDMNTYDRATAEGWQEFYYPTMVNPEWSEMMERELRQQFSEVAYEHEVKCFDLAKLFLIDLKPLCTRATGRKRNAA